MNLRINKFSNTNNPHDALKTVRYLLDRNPNVKLQTFDGKSLLHSACLEPPEEHYDYDSNIDAALEAIKVIYDAHPEAIEDNEFAQNIQHWHPQVQVFLYT